MNIVKLIEKGEDALKKKNFDYAIEILLQAVSFAPNNRRAREALRKAELKKHEHAYPGAAALAIFGLPAKLGMMFSSKKTNPEGYMMACEKYLTKDPKSKRVNMALGEAAAIGGHVDTAILAYETVTEHHPNDVTALKMLGNLLRRNGQINEAHAVFDKAVRLAPQDQEALKSRKNLAAEASLKETGFETARSSRDLVRDKDAAGKLEAETRIHKTEDDLASQHAELQARSDKEPDNVDLLQRLADVCKRMKDWDGAFAALDKGREAQGQGQRIKERHQRQGPGKATREAAPVSLPHRQATAARLLAGVARAPMRTRTSLQEAVRERQQGARQTGGDSEEAGLRGGETARRGARPPRVDGLGRR